MKPCRRKQAFAVHSLHSGFAEQPFTSFYFKLLSLKYKSLLIVKKIARNGKIRKVNATPKTSKETAWQCLYQTKYLIINIFWKMKT
jgi:hypothetical protein